MVKVLKYIFLFLIIPACGYSQSSNYFGSICLKLNEKDNSLLAAFPETGKQLFFKDNISLNGFSKNENNLFSIVSRNVKRSDSVEALRKKLNPLYPLWVPVTEVIGINFGLGAFNTYVSKSAFAKISFKTLQKNFQTGSVWDHDHFITNFFAHPYHGNLYFNAARSNGYSFLESVPFSFGGSLMWELFMENEPPAINDLINTTVSGYYLGEILYRLSSLVIDERQSGIKRITSEVIAGILNPMRGFNRLLQGKVSRVTSTEAYEVQPLLINVSYGVNRILEGTKFFTGIANGVIDLNMVYGNPFKEEKRKPFDFFRLRGSFNFGAGQSVIGTVTSYGILAGKNYIKKDHSILVGLFQHYDFFDNTTYKVGGISFGAGLLTLYKTLGNKSLATVIHLNVMPLGATNSEYSAFGEKEYNFTAGVNMKFEGTFDLGWGDALVNYNLYYMHTLVGAPSNEFVGLLRPRIRVKIYKGLGVGAEYVFYHREGYYKNYPDVFVRNNESKLFVYYNFENPLTFW